MLVPIESLVEEIEMARSAIIAVDSNLNNPLILEIKSKANLKDIPRPRIETRKYGKDGGSSIRLTTDRIIGDCKPEKKL